MLGWNAQASWLAGVALSTTSMAVVYAVMLEFGFNKTEFGKGILGACFINDLGTVIALGLIFAPFTYRTAVFVASVGCADRLVAGDHLAIDLRGTAIGPPQFEPSGFCWCLCGWDRWRSGRETKRCCPRIWREWCWPRPSARDNFYIRRLRTLTIGFLTPFYFLRAGSLVSLPSVGIRSVGVPGALFGENRLEGVRPLSGDRHVPRRQQGDDGTTR